MSNLHLMILFQVFALTNSREMSTPPLPHFTTDNPQEALKAARDLGNHPDINYIELVLIHRVVLGQRYHIKDLRSLADESHDVLVYCANPWHETFKNKDFQRESQSDIAAA